MKNKLLKRLHGQFLFNLFSILFLLSIGSYFLGRLFYYKSESEKEIIPASTLALRLIEEDYGNYNTSLNDLTYSNETYRYVGDATGNYVKFKGFLWRIVKINKDNTVTLITQNSVTSLPFGTSLEQFIMPWLNKSEKPFTGIMETSLEDTKELENTSFCTDTFAKLEESTCFDTQKNYKISLLSVNDYLEANANESYLNNGEIFWTSNRSNKKDAWFITEDGKLSYDKDTNKYGIRPVITISGDTTIVSGNGSADNPYLLTEHTVETIQDSFVGEYLTYHNQLWKIVAKENGKVKIVSETCLLDNNQTCLQLKYSDFSNNIMKSELISYLNKTYLSSLPNSEFLTNGTFYTGTYSLNDNNYMSSLSSYQNLYVGFLAIGEIFAYELDNVFLMNSSPNNELSIYSVKNHSLYQNMVTTPLEIRPSLYLKGNITITEGDGSYLSPYQLGGIEK